VILSEAIIYKYGFQQGLDIIGTANGERITKWPYAEEQPKVSELAGIIAEYQPVVDKDKAVKDSKAILNSLIENNRIEIRAGVFVKARPSDYLNISKVIESLEPGGIYPDWHQGAEVFNVSREELERVILEGEAQLFKAHAEHSARIKAL
jgi:hypothetical protein